jgi:hypothetical protein
MNDVLIIALDIAFGLYFVFVFYVQVIIVYSGHRT